MILDIAEDRLVVVSDLHLGNPASQAGKTFRAFLDYVRREHLCLCINGDGFEMLQTRFSRLIREALPLLGQISRLRREGGRVWYVVGNHDIYMEHFLDEWLVTGVSPFLNVTSGDKRIRIEHGHLYARPPEKLERDGRGGFEKGGRRLEYAALDGAIERVGWILGVEDPVAGWAILLVVGLVLGLIYVPTVGRLGHTWGTGALYGLAYGAVWWVLATLVIMPPLLGHPMFAVGPATWVNLTGYLLYGLALGLTYAGMAGRRRAQTPPRRSGSCRRASRTRRAVRRHGEITSGSNRGAHVGDLGAFGQLVHHEGVQAVVVRQGHVHQEVLVPRGDEHGQGVRQGADPVAEGLDVVTRGFHDADGDERLHRAADEFEVHVQE